MPSSKAPTLAALVHIQLRTLITSFWFTLSWSASGDVICGGKQQLRKHNHSSPQASDVHDWSFCVKRVSCSHRWQHETQAWYRQTQRAHLNSLISYLPLSSVFALPAAIIKDVSVLSILHRGARSIETQTLPVTWLAEILFTAIVQFLSPQKYKTSWSVCGSVAGC